MEKFPSRSEYLFGAKKGNDTAQIRKSPNGSRKRGGKTRDSRKNSDYK